MKLATRGNAFVKTCASIPIASCIDNIWIAENVTPTSIKWPPDQIAGSVGCRYKLRTLSAPSAQYRAPPSAFQEFVSFFPERAFFLNCYHGSSSLFASARVELLLITGDQSYRREFTRPTKKQLLSMSSCLRWAIKNWYAKVKHTNS